MFSSIGLFKDIPCPEQSQCSLFNCIFSHPAPSQNSIANGSGIEHPPPEVLVDERADHPKAPLSVANGYHDDAPDQNQSRKKRRLSQDGEFHPAVQNKMPMGPRRQPLANPQAVKELESARLPSSAIKEVSPPPPRNFKTKAAEHLLAKAEAVSKIKTSSEPKLNGPVEPGKKTPEVSLNPRMIKNPPAAHAVRMQLIKLLHEQMVRLDDEVWQSQDASKTALKLSPQELIIEALEEEENVAKQNPTVYLNVVKLRITKLKKMKLPEWKEERLRQIAKRVPATAATGPKAIPQTIETGLSSSQEISFLSNMFAKQPDLIKFGYVPSPPSDEEITRAREGVEAGQGWEQCDRCKTRFQVFPGRRKEDGALTSGGTCSYHPARPRRPPAKDNSDKGHRDLMYACCNESVGTSIGCTTASSHVFKVSDPKRMAVILPFKKTPPKLLTPGPNRAVCFDCEMGYTTMGLELIRLTATSWPDGEELLDVLVRPLGEILDLNSQFSGVFSEHYSNAIPYGTNEGTKIGESKTNQKAALQLVESPLVARDLLFELLTPETPLIGHALDNDLNAVRVVHPCIVDSVLLYPHPRGLPIRFGLKVLMKTHLDRDIQMGGAEGHDSKEDARAAGDLVRLKVANMWEAMRKDGWTVRKLEFCPPLPSASTFKYPFGSYVGQSKLS
ncbi:RNA exonuclease 3 [Lecanora helva]